MAVQPLDAGAHPTCEAYLRAGEQFGLARNPDYNDGDMHGVALFQHTIENGIRASTAHAYLRAAKQRSNLSILTRAQITQVEFSGRRAIGVAGHHRGQPLLVQASREVILSAGAINTPLLLELSGAGDSKRLRTMGIRITRHLGGVGEHLQDHLGLDHLYRARVPTLNQELAPWRGKLWSALRYLFTRRGPLALSVNQGAGFVSLDDRDPRPDLQLYYSPLRYTPAPAGSRPLMSPDAFPGFLLGFNPCRPTSRGSTHLRSADPFSSPAIRPNYLSTEFDRAQLLAGARMLREFAAMPALAAIIDEELLPGGGPLDDDAMWAFITANAWTVFHPCGSCRMGNDPTSSVVDPRLRVHGLTGLRVVDASVFPSIPSANTNAPAIVTAERAADLIMDDQRFLRADEQLQSEGLDRGRKRVEVVEYSIRSELGERHAVIAEARHNEGNSCAFGRQAIVAAVPHQRSSVASDTHRFERPGQHAGIGFTEGVSVASDHEFEVAVQMKPSQDTESRRVRFVGADTEDIARLLQ